MNALERRFFDLTNLQRTRRRLRALAESNALSDAARRHSEDMLRRRFFAHNGPDGRTPADRVAAALHRPVTASAENIWMRSGDLPSPTPLTVVDEAFSQLMASPVHRRNIIDARYTHLGIGVAVTASEFRATQVFARLEG